MAYAMLARAPRLDTRAVTRDSVFEFNVHPNIGDLRVLDGSRETYRERERERERGRYQEKETERAREREREREREGQTLGERERARAREKERARNGACAW